MARFDTFTERARRLFNDAQVEAQRFHQASITTEDLLLALIGIEDGVGATVLVNLGVELAEVRTAVEFLVGDRPIHGEAGLTPSAKRVVELSIEEARSLHHHFVGTEHILLGLAREQGTIASGVLESMGATPERIRAEVIRLVPVGSAQPPSTGPLPGAGRIRELSDEFKEVLRLAQADALRLQLGAIGTGQLLVGLLGTPRCAGATVLDNLGVDLPTLRTAIEPALDHGHHSKRGEIGLTPGGKAVIERARAEAGRMDHEYVGTEHLLLGLLRDVNMPTSLALELLGVSYSVARAEVLRMTPAGPDAEEVEDDSGRDRLGDSADDDCVDELLRASSAYIEPLARYKGRDETLFVALCAVLDQCASEWAEREFVPRALAKLCASLPWQIATIALNYHGEESEAIKRDSIKLDELVVSRVLPWPVERKLPPDLR